ncbi:MAG TPA: leucyl aminopeptidase [Candidatus Polarisedimenticolaceae bacterium]
MNVEVAKAGASSRAAIVLMRPGDRAPQPVARRLALAGFGGARGETVSFEAGGRLWIAAGVGVDASPVAWHDAALRAAREAGRVRCGAADLHFAKGALPDPAGLRAAVVGLHAGAYRFDRYRTIPGKNGHLERAAVAGIPGAVAKEAVARGNVVGRAVALARDLANEPPSRLDPPELARRAATVAKASGCTAKVLDEKAIGKLGFGAMAAVGAGSGVPSRVVHLVYRPGGKASRRTVLVGKGVTFDSGGLQIKPGPSMLGMKADMAGAAAVIAAMGALAESGCREEVHGFIGLVENMTGGRAFKPGDVVTTASGRTVEIVNTDAEGRLVLCDLITHAARTVQPDRIVDVATLTGHVVIALGTLATGVFSNDAALEEEILGAARDAGERFWPLPIYDDYGDELRDGPADLKNAGERWGGAISAALFVREFVPKGVPWVHLDIAGPAFLEAPKGPWPVGATGASVPTLLRWLER